MDKHNAIILGKKVRKIYEADGYFCMVREFTKVIDRVNMFSGEIDNPPLQVGEMVYITSYNKSFEVTDKSRNVDGGYVYYTDFILETIEDDETEKSKLEAEEMLEELKNDFKNRTRETIRQQLIKDFSKRNLFQRIFNKFQ